MAIGTNAFTSYGKVVDREDLVDIIKNIDPVDTQFQSSIGSVNATATLHEWPVDVLAAAALNVNLEAVIVSATAITAPTRITNRCQHLIKSFTISDVQEAVKSAGNSSSSSYQKAKTLKELARDLEYSMIINSAAISGDTATAPKMCGAIGAIATNVVCGATASAITEAQFNTLLATVWATAGKPKAFTMFMGVVQKKIVDAFTGNGTRFNEVDAKDAALNATVSVYYSSFGKCLLDLHQIMHSDAPGRILCFADLSNFRKAWLIKPTGFEKMARTGTFQQYAVSCSLTLEYGAEKSAGQSYNFKTT
jgi:hypothetical protein